MGGLCWVLPLEEEGEGTEGAGLCGGGSAQLLEEAVSCLGGRWRRRRAAGCVLMVPQVHEQITPESDL